MFNGPVFLNETIQANARAVNAGGISESLDEANALYSRLSGASFKLVPSSFGRGVLYSGAPGVNGDLTWTRGSDAFRTNASGVIQRMPWNLLQYSEMFSDINWGKEGSSITANTTNAPNGTLTADSLTENSAASTQHRLLQSAGTIASGASFTFSCYVKQGVGTRDFALIATSAGIRVYFNLSTGTVGTQTLGTGTISNVGDGWYRVTATGTSTATSAACYLAMTNGTTTGSETYSGNGTSSLIIWGAQLVEGTTAQTYLPTTDRLNFPRLSYMYGSCPSALAEPQRTNLVLYSEQFDNASWTKPFGWTITANATTSPDGTSNADLITPTNFNNLSQSCVVTTSTNYAISIYVKRNTTNSTWVSLIFSGGTSISYGYVINWSTLSISLIPVRTAATNPTFESVGNGWYRISFVCASGNNTSASLQIIPDSQAGTNSIYLYGAQLEAGAYPTTYIPTTSATATRVADSFSRNNIYTNGLISASGGTWFVELRGNVAYTRDNGNTNLILLDTSGTNFFRFRNDGTPNSRLRIQKQVSGVNTDLIITPTDTCKIAIKWNGTSADVFINGTKEISATSFTATQLQDLTATPQVPTFIQQMALFPTPKSDQFCTDITTL